MKDYTNLHNNIKAVLKEFNFYSKENNDHIYLSLFFALKKAIIDRVLKAGTKLPPTRILAKDLEISRSTVIKTYELLVLEKFLIAIQGSGYFVTNVRHKKNHIKIQTGLKSGKYPEISKKGKSFGKFINIENTKKKGIAFRPGLPPLDIFPINIWKNLTNNYWRSAKASELTYSNAIGLESLRQNISEYLKIYRNIKCDPSQIIITTGSLHSLSMIADSLINKDDEVVLENPIYPNAYTLFKSLEAKIIAAQIDEQGMIVENLVCQKPKILYNTPSNQYPSGVKMSLNRRLEILRWASLHNTIIIEDDYDHEFSNWEDPISSIYSLDNEDRTVYLGTFNKLLHPSLRVGYMIVPDYLNDPIQAIYGQTSRFVPPSTQSILSSFIEKDQLNRHLRNIIEVSQERKSFFLGYFEDHFQEKIKIENYNTGLHFIGKLENKENDLKLSQHFASSGIVAHPLSSYFFDGKYANGLVMGYSSVNQKITKQTILKMKQEYLNYKN